MPLQGLAVIANPPASATRIVPRTGRLMIRYLYAGTLAGTLGLLNGKARPQLRASSPAA